MISVAFLLRCAAGSAARIIPPETPQHNGRAERGCRNDRRCFYDRGKSPDVKELNKKAQRTPCIQRQPGIRLQQAGGISALSCSGQCCAADGLLDDSAAIKLCDIIRHGNAQRRVTGGDRGAEEKQLLSGQRAIRQRLHVFQMVLLSVSRSLPDIIFLDKTQRAEALCW